MFVICQCIWSRSKYDEVVHFITPWLSSSRFLSNKTYNRYLYRDLFKNSYGQPSTYLVVGHACLFIRFIAWKCDFLFLFISVYFLESSRWHRNIFFRNRRGYLHTYLQPGEHLASCIGLRSLGELCMWNAKVEIYAKALTFVLLRRQVLHTSFSFMLLMSYELVHTLFGIGSYFNILRTFPYHYMHCHLMQPSIYIPIY